PTNQAEVPPPELAPTPPEAPLPPEPAAPGPASWPGGPGAGRRRTLVSGSRRTRAATAGPGRRCGGVAGGPGAPATAWPRWAGRPRTNLEKPYSNRARTSVKALGEPSGPAPRRRPPRLAEATRHRPARLVKPVLPPTVHR